MFPSIPEGGTKSRVETQVRLTVDLAHASTSADPLKYDRVGSWKWLRLPKGTSTKRRTRKEGKIGALCRHLCVHPTYHFRRCLAGRFAVLNHRYHLCFAAAHESDMLYKLPGS